MPKDNPPPNLPKIANIIADVVISGTEYGEYTADQCQMRDVPHRLANTWRSSGRQRISAGRHVYASGL
jgi:hypothetical protein